MAGQIKFKSAEVWSIDGQLSLVWYVPDSDPPIPMFWRITDEQSMNGIFGQDMFTDENIDRVISTEQLGEIGAIDAGVATELDQVLANSEHPFETFRDAYATEAQVQPWLQDPEFQALSAEAWIENRDITDAERQSTEWWRNTKPGLRQWYDLASTDPLAAEQLISDNEIKVRDSLRSAGISEPPESLVSYMARQVSIGQWTPTYLNEQIRRLVDPRDLELDPNLEVLTRLNPFSVEGLVNDDQYRNRVTSLVNQWLGPKFAAGWSDSQVNNWVGRLMTEEGADASLTAYLQKQRQVLFPQYTNPELTYEDIASTWRQQWGTIWGELPDETSDLWMKAIGMNDSASFAQLLRKEGLQRKNKKVTQSAMRDLLGAFGGQVRQGLEVN